MMLAKSFTNIGMAMAGRVEADEQIFESKNDEATFMRIGVATLMVVMFAFSVFSPIASADGGREAPTCTSLQIAFVPSILDVDDGACIIIELGQLESGTVHEFEFIIVDDALDILFFDENSIQVYELGQSYRSAFDQTTSTESANGSIEFHWKVPPSITSKEWFIVLDNLAHDGDGGQGDQGGATSKVGLEWQQSSDSYWTPFHNLVKVNNDEFAVLLTPNDAKYDAGTVVVISMWGLDGVGDLFIQTSSMHSTYTAGEVGVQYVTGGALQGVSNTASLTYVVPSDLNGQGLYFVLDNTDSPLGGGDGSTLLRTTVRVELSPPIAPSFEPNTPFASTDEVVTFSAEDTPNSLGQIESFSWDFDHLVDTNGDGNFTNDVNAVGQTSQTSWSTPGTKVVTLAALVVDGRTVSFSQNITVEDNEAPNAIIGSSAVWVNPGFRQLWGQSASYNCLDSTDNIGVTQCSWSLDGVDVEGNFSITLSWETIGSHTLNLVVYDGALNEDNASITIQVVDTSIPSLSNASINGLPKKATIDSAVRFQVDANDAYDDLGMLRVHWDLSPNIDTDGNGNPRDDGDYLGFNPKITFGSKGLQDLVVTVFDQSNNSQSYAFSVNVEVPETTTSNTGQMVVAGIFMFLIAGLVVVVVFRINQTKRAKQLLMEAGLPEEEALLRIEMVRQQRKITPFSKAEYIAGLDLGQVRTRAEIEQEERRKEIEGIYGVASQPSPPASQEAMYQPQQSRSMVQPQQSMGSFSAAVEAADLLGIQLNQPPQSMRSQPLEGFEDLFEEETTNSSLAEEPSVSTLFFDDEDEQPPQQPAAKSKVSLPDSFIVTKPQQEPQPSQHIETHHAQQELSQPPSVSSFEQGRQLRKVVHQCTSCSVRFEIEIPNHLSKVLVECPSCHQDQTLS